MSYESKEIKNTINPLGERQALIARVARRDWNFPKETGSNALFGLHPYPAKFIPQIPRALIQDLGVSAGGVVFDPFCGSGTTLIEAQSMGFRTLGIDVNPIACLISRVATSPQPPELETAIDRCITFARTIRNPQIANIPNVDHWFKKPIQKAISAIRAAIEKETCDKTRDILLLALSSTIVKVSNQDSDTRYAAVEKRVSAKDVFSNFQKASNRSLASLPTASIEYPSCAVQCTDILDITAADIPSPVGLVICSPPYPNAYEYWLYHKYRMWWLGYDPLYVKEHEIGARPHYYKKDPQTPDDFREQMKKVFRLFAEVCIDNSYVCFVLGDSKIHGQIIDNTALLCEAAQNHNFESVAVLNRDIALNRKSFNLDNSRIKSENIIIFQKRRRLHKSTTTTAELSWHKYKYLPYEKNFALRELTAIPGIRSISMKRDIVTIDILKRSHKKLQKLVYFSEYSLSSGEPQKTLQAKFENGIRRNGNGKRQSTRYGAHGLHDYKGKFNPQIVRGILNAQSLPSSTKVLDPFCGSGTTLIESAIAGHSAIGWDINPFAAFLANAKIVAMNTDPRSLRILAEHILQSYDQGKYDVAMNGDKRIAYLLEWFPKGNLRTAEAFRNIITTSTDEVAPFFLVVLSDLLRDYSLQEPSDLRIRRRKSPLPKVKFRDRLEKNLIERIEALERSYQVSGAQNIKAIAYEVDGRKWSNIERLGIKKESVDFALTSPPYATALPYIDTQRLSLVWLELLEPSSIRAVEETLIGSREASKAKQKRLSQAIFDNEGQLPHGAGEYCKLLYNHVSESDGFRRRAVPALLYRYFIEMMETFVTVKTAMKPGGTYTLIVGTNRTMLGGKQFQIDTPRFLAEIAESKGWNILELYPLETYRRFGLHSANAVLEETMVVLKK
ncbi:MAG: DNA methyltransferase [Candidatus Paceibacterota bacterium]